MDIGGGEMLKRLEGMGQGDEGSIGEQEWFDASSLRIDILRCPISLLFLHQYWC